MGTLTPPNDRSRNLQPFHDLRAGERSLLSRKTSLSCTQISANKARSACAEFPDGLWALAPDDVSEGGRGRKRQMQSSPAPSASDAASSQSSGSASGSLSTPFSVSTSDTASSSLTTTLASLSSPISSAPASASSTDSTSSIPDTTSSSIISTDDPSSVASTTTTTPIITSTSPPLSATSESDTDSAPDSTSTATTTPDTASTTTTTPVITSASPPLSATSESDTDSAPDSTSTATTTPDTSTTSPPLSATTTESDSDSPSVSTTGETDIPSASSTAVSVSATSASHGVSSSDTTSISASVPSISASSIILSSASADSPSSSSSAVLSLPPQSPSQDSSIRLSSKAPLSAAAASGSIFSSTTTVLSFPSITGADNLASPAPPNQAPTAFITVPPSTPTTPLDFTPTALLTHLGVVTAPGPLSGSLFTTTIVYTSGGSVFTTVSTGVFGTGRPWPAPHNFAHNIGAIIGIALGGGVAVILIVVAVFCACERFKPRTHREFMLRGTAKGLRRPPGPWRSPIDGDSVYSLVSDGVDEHGDADTSLLQAESGMREVRHWGSAPPFPFLDAADIASADSYTPDSFAQMPDPDLILLHDAIWLPTPPSSLSLSIPALLAGRASSDLSTPPMATPRSSLLNPPSSTVALTSPSTPRSAMQSLPQVAEPLPSVAEPIPGTPIADALPSPEPTPTEGLLRPSLTALQSHSSRTLEDHVDYSRFIGAGAGAVRQRTGSGNTFDTASSKADSVASSVR
ncbi:hypothetical protein B0H13DRAFT_2671415 [Mycena leptocephala]|nr:hypothetical protein B0H13DRAFT_2671415 [Mycena leptocephala]